MDQEKNEAALDLCPLSFRSENSHRPWRRPRRLRGRLCSCLAFITRAVFARGVLLMK